MQSLRDIPEIKDNVQLMNSIPKQFVDADMNNDLSSTVRQISIKTKRELYDYLNYDFSQIFFTPGKFVQ